MESWRESRSHKSKLWECRRRNRRNSVDAPQRYSATTPASTNRQSHCRDGLLRNTTRRFWIRSTKSSKSTTRHRRDRRHRSVSIRSPTTRSLSEKPSKLDNENNAKRRGLLCCASARAASCFCSGASWNGGRRTVGGNSDEVAVIGRQRRALND